MHTMDMGSAEAALTQMAHIPSASSSSYFLQLDPSGQIDILESSLVLTKPDMRDETVYEIQLDPCVMDERNLELINFQNLQNLQNTVTLQPTEFLPESQQFTTTFEPQQFQFQIDDINLQQLLAINDNSIQQATTVPAAEIKQLVEEDDYVPDFTIETEIESEFEPPSSVIDMPLQNQCIDIKSSPQHEVCIKPSETKLEIACQMPVPETKVEIMIEESPKPIDMDVDGNVKHTNEEAISTKQEIQTKEVGGSATTLANLDSSNTKKEKEVPLDNMMEVEEAVVPPLIEIYPTTPAKEEEALPTPVVTICEEDEDEEDDFNDYSDTRENAPMKPEFLFEGMDPDDELYISFLSRPDSNKTAMCILCYEWFDSMPSLQDHLKSVHQDNMKLYGCKRCGKKFWSRFLRQRHEKQHRYDLRGPSKRYFPQKRPFDHYEAKHFYKRLRPAPLTSEYREKLKLLHCEIKSMEFGCIQCDAEFSSEEEYREHHEQNHAVQTCVHCRKLFDNGNELSDHVEQEHGQYGITKNYPGGAWKLWESWECDEMKNHEERTVNLYLDHGYYSRLKTEPRNGEVPNGTTGSKFVGFGIEEVTVHEYEAAKVTKSGDKRKSVDKQQNSVKVHRTNSSNHQSESSKGRKSAPKSTATKVDIDYDKIEFVEESITEESTLKQTDLPYKCDGCKTSFDNDIDLQRHLKSHTIRSMAYMCQYCGRGFATHSNRKEHERIHTGDKPYVCPICNRAFVQISNLKKHIQTHKEKNNLQCSTCSKQFVKESSLILHQRAHSQDRKFRCHICDRAYNYASLLKRHMRIHTGENPYSCEDCGQQFHELVSLHYHRKKVHTGERPHRCDSCGRAFILSSDLKKHLKIHLRDANNIKAGGGTTPKVKSSKSNSVEETILVANADGSSTGATIFPESPIKGNNSTGEVTPNSIVVSREIKQDISDGSRVLVISENNLLNLTETIKTDDLNSMDVASAENENPSDLKQDCNTESIS